jgi:hypothetical protein
MNEDPDTAGYPAINFCSDFFGLRSLSDAISRGKSLNSPYNLLLSQYNNRGHAFLVSWIKNIEAKSLMY